MEPSLPERSKSGKFSPLEKQEGKITQDYLKTIVSYDPATGIFTWLINYHDRMKGKPAGTNNKGYKYLKINSQTYLAHRLAFLYMTGKLPELSVDHKDGIKNNNAWDNLREATAKQNMHNRSATKRSKLGVKGVSFHKSRGVYQVQMSLGCYKTLEEAKAVYDEAARKLHGEFFRK